MILITIEFPVLEKHFSKIEVENNICINAFGYENVLVFSIYLPDPKLEDSVDLLLLIDDEKSNYVYIKDFERFMFHKTRNKNKKWFCKSCLQCFSNENVLTKHKEVSLIINGKQSLKLGKGIIEFENYFKEIPVPFKIYADFECNLKGAESYEGSYTKNIKNSFLVVWLTKLPHCALHWNCNINLQMTKNVPIIFHNLRGYDSHLIFCKLNFWWCEN